MKESCVQVTVDRTTGHALHKSGIGKEKENGQMFHFLDVSIYKDIQKTFSCVCGDFFTFFLFVTKFENLL